MTVKLAEDRITLQCFSVPLGFLLLQTKNSSISVFLSISTSSTTNKLNELTVVISPPGSALKITGLMGRMSAFLWLLCLENVYLCMMCAWIWLRACVCVSLSLYHELIGWPAWQLLSCKVCNTAIGEEEATWMQGHHRSSYIFFPSEQAGRKTLCAFNNSVWHFRIGCQRARWRAAMLSGFLQVLRDATEMLHVWNALISYFFFHLHKFSVTNVEHWI